MFDNTILDTVATFGYIAGFMGILACVVAYFVLPKAIKMLLNDDDKKE